MVGNSNQLQPRGQCDWPENAAYRRASQWKWIDCGNGKLYELKKIISKTSTVIRMDCLCLIPFPLRMVTDCNSYEHWKVRLQNWTDEFDCKLLEKKRRKNCSKVGYTQNRACSYGWLKVTGKVPSIVTGNILLRAARYSFIKPPWRHPTPPILSWPGDWSPVTSARICRPAWILSRPSVTDELWLSGHNQIFSRRQHERLDVTELPFIVLSCWVLQVWRIKGRNQRRWSWLVLDFAAISLFPDRDCGWKIPISTERLVNFLWRSTYANEYFKY